VFIEPLPKNDREHTQPARCIICLILSLQNKENRLKRKKSKSEEDRGKECRKDIKRQMERERRKDEDWKKEK
jgi:hypothetical protein